MKNKGFIIGAAVLAVLLVLCAVVLNFNTVQIDDYAAAYKEAAAVFLEAKAATVTISKKLETAFDNQIFHEDCTQILTFDGIGTSTPCANLTETSVIGSNRVEVTEKYTGGNMYFTINGSNFSAKMHHEDYFSRFAPIVLLNADLYQSVTGKKSDNGFIITFSQPTAAEGWAVDSGATLMDAQGTAYLDKNGALVKSEYAITYKKGNMTFRQTVTASPTLTASVTDSPVDESLYTEINYPDGPKLLERVSGYLMQATTVSAGYTDNGYFQAFGDKRQQSIAVNVFEFEPWSVSIGTSVSLSNEGKVGQVSTSRKEELFSHGIYTVRNDAGDPVADSRVSEADMLRYYRNLLISTVMLPQYITQADILEANEVLYVSFSGNEKFAQLISSNVCKIMYQNENLLTELAQSSTVDMLTYELKLDAFTGLPLSSAIKFQGTYTIGSVPYSLQFTADQLYDFVGY